jgi:GAF domain-containing protein
LSELLELVYEQINTVINAQSFYIALYEPFHDEVSFPFAIERGERRRWAERKAGRGLTEHVLRTREPMLLADRVVERLDALGVEAIETEALSWMGAPLLVGDKEIGMIGVQDLEQEGAFTQADLDLLAALANQVAVAIENARLYENVHHQAVYLRLSAEVGRWITTILDVDQLLSLVVELICTGFGYYHVDIGLIDSETDLLVYRAGSTAGAVEMTTGRPSLKVDDDTIVGWVAGRGEPLLVKVHQDPRYRRWVILPDTQSELVVPLKVGSKTVGVLNVESDALNAFHPEDVPMMYALADQVAVAVQNAQLFGERERRIQELELLARTGQG